MIDCKNTPHHPLMEEIVDVLSKATQNPHKEFFRVEVAYFLAKVAATMRATITSKDRGTVPINVYAVALSSSGTGKGYSINLIEHEILDQFRIRFLQDVMPEMATRTIYERATHKATKNNTDIEEEYEAIEKAYKAMGEYPFTFDSGTTPALKQLREKLLLANVGAINASIDEIGEHLIENAELLTTFLELYDQGMVKPKLTKNTKENIRNEQIEGKTPANLLLFGTPTRLFDGDKTEERFISFLDAGYARRSIFTYLANVHRELNNKTAEEVYKEILKINESNVYKNWSNYFAQFADISYAGKDIKITDEVAIALIQYQKDCELLASGMNELQEMHKAEMTHRYFKASKIAGAFAFVDKCDEVSLTHLAQAIKLVEESGKAFNRILQREKPYEKVAKYIAHIGSEVTHADLCEALPFYSKGSQARQEMMLLATAWGYKNNILIKKSFMENIELYSGETLKETDLNQIKISYSNSLAGGYIGETVAFDKLFKLVTAKDLHWCNHHFIDGYRKESNAIPGFNILVLDVDEGMNIPTVKELLKDYTYLIHTTKRHTDLEHRFRVILPMNYALTLDETDYKEFMLAVCQNLPFNDMATLQRSRKWLTNHNAKYYYNEGRLFDVLSFIPKTSRYEQQQTENQSVRSYTNIERWFANEMTLGNRNNTLLRYAMLLVGTGQSLSEVESNIKRFNKSLAKPLPNEEVDNTIMTTVRKRYE